MEIQTKVCTDWWSKHHGCLDWAPKGAGVWWTSVLTQGFLGVLEQHCTTSLILSHMENVLCDYLSECSPSLDVQLGPKIPLLLGSMGPNTKCSSRRSREEEKTTPWEEGGSKGCPHFSQDGLQVCQEYYLTSLSKQTLCPEIQVWCMIHRTVSFGQGNKNPLKMQV